MLGPSLLVPALLIQAFQHQRNTPLPTWLWVMGMLAGVSLMVVAFGRLGAWAETRGWIYFRTAKTSGLGAGTLLDLDILWGTPRHQVEQVRLAREAGTEGQQQPGAGEDPPMPKNGSSPRHPSQRINAQ